MTDEHDALRALESAIGYDFIDRGKLLIALTHTSFRNESREAVEDYQRLEFLGDSLINAIVAAIAFDLAPEAGEGELTRLRASAVSEQALSSRALALDLGSHLRLGRGAAVADHIRTAPSVLADCFEALVGAVYLDGGFEAAREFVTAQIGPDVAARNGFHTLVDPKSALQETCLKESHEAPSYQVIEQTGPPHHPSFTVRVTLPDGRTATGTGGSKKEAEQAAAMEALRL